MLVLAKVEIRRAWDEVTDLRNRVVIVRNVCILCGEKGASDVLPARYVAECVKGKGKEKRKELLVGE